MKITELNYQADIQFQQKHANQNNIPTTLIYKLKYVKGNLKKKD